MEKKVIILLLAVFICSSVVHSQTNYQLTNEQETWLSKANRHEKNGWIYLHIEGSPGERGFQYGYLLSDQIKESIRIITTVWEYRSAMKWEWLVNKAGEIFTPKIDSENIEELDGISSIAPEIKQSYGGSLHQCSHGESFFALLNNRLGGHGVYLFDEPEAALSPQRQLAMLCRIDELVKQDSQLIIATHSPILTAYPNSMIYTLSETGIQQTEYQQTDNYQITKQFLNNYSNMLKNLLE